MSDPTPSTSPPVAGGLTRAAIVAAARRFVGTPYHHQASVEGVGTDCLGLVRGVYRIVVGVEAETPPPYARDWGDADGRERLLEAACRHLERIDSGQYGPGDVLLFRLRPHLVAKHAAIVSAPGFMIHAAEGHGTAEVSLVGWWRRRIAAVLRFPGVHD